MTSPISDKEDDEPLLFDIDIVEFPDNELIGIDDLKLGFSSLPHKNYPNKSQIPKNFLSHNDLKKVMGFYAYTGWTISTPKKAIFRV